MSANMREIYLPRGRPRIYESTQDRRAAANARRRDARRKKRLMEITEDEPTNPISVGEDNLQTQQQSINMPTNDQFQDRQKAFNHREVEARIAAIQAIQMTEVPATLACLRALRSSLSEEQLQTPCLKFFQENLPNLLVVRNKESKIFELRRIDENCGGNEVNSFGNAVGDLHFFEESVKHSFLNAANLPISDFRSCVTVLDGVSDAQMSRMSGVGDMFQTPGGTSNRLSFGMTPKTSRLPKQGEMLLSVHGSPLGVFKEDHLEAIPESEDGSQPASSGI